MTESKYCPHCGCYVPDKEITCRACHKRIDILEDHQDDTDVYGLYADNVLIETSRTCSIERVNTPKGQRVVVKYPIWDGVGIVFHPYKKGDVVWYNGCLYESMIDDNIFTPKNGLFWQTYYEMKRRKI